MGTGKATISIIEADADLADLLDPEELERARREAIARTLTLSPSEWDAASAIRPSTVTAAS